MDDNQAMRLSDFDYPLPAELIAQEPLAERGASRLLVVDRQTRSIHHGVFSELSDFLHPGDLLVRNDTRVIPARLCGRKASGGRVELLLVAPAAESPLCWECLLRSSKPARPGVRLHFPGKVVAEVLAGTGNGHHLVRFEPAGDFFRWLDAHGEIPLPPYIRRPATAADSERYQTVFAREPGAVAAPTAGLHFTPATFADLAARAVQVCSLTLHVGPGTFQPVRSEALDEHRMHAEVYDIPAATAAAVDAARCEGRRVIAIGTTTTRALESAVAADGKVSAGRASSELFIRPGYRFRAIDALLTNFHLPKSTLLVLVAAFAGRDLILEAYRQAVAERYRFFSYGDCMLIL